MASVQFWLERRVGLALLAGLFLGGGAPSRLPEFQVETVSGSWVSRADFGGKILYLVFFQEGCVACEKEVPALNRLRRRYAEEFQVLGIGYQSGELTQLRRVVEKMGMEYPAGVDRQNLAGKLGLSGLPFGVLADEYGYVVQKYYGFRPGELETEVEKQIARLRGKRQSPRLVIAPVNCATQAAKSRGLDQELFQRLAAGLKGCGFVIVSGGEPAEWVVEGSVSLSGKIAGVSLVVKQKGTEKELAKVEKTVMGGDFSEVVEEVCRQAAGLK